MAFWRNLVAYFAPSALGATGASPPTGAAAASPPGVFPQVSNAPYPFSSQITSPVSPSCGSGSRQRGYRSRGGSGSEQWELGAGSLWARGGPTVGETQAGIRLWLCACASMSSVPSAAPSSWTKCGLRFLVLVPLVCFSCRTYGTVHALPDQPWTRIRSVPFPGLPRPAHCGAPSYFLL